MPSIYELAYLISFHGSIRIQIKNRKFNKHAIIFFSDMVARKCKDKFLHNQVIILNNKNEIASTKNPETIH